MFSNDSMESLDSGPASRALSLRRLSQVLHLLHVFQLLHREPGQWPRQPGFQLTQAQPGTYSFPPVAAPLSLSLILYFLVSRRAAGRGEGVFMILLV
jgi:hypothetical protein